MFNRILNMFTTGYIHCNLPCEEVDLLDDICKTMDIYDIEYIDDQVHFVIDKVNLPKYRAIVSGWI